MSKRKNPAAVALGKRGARKGGLASAKNLTAEERSERARNAVKARWAKQSKNRPKPHAFPPYTGEELKRFGQEATKRRKNSKEQQA